MYKATIFDLDGVLIETEGLHINAMRMAFSDLGYDLTPEDINSTIARAPVEYVPELLNKHKWDINKSEKIISKFREIFHPLWDKEVVLKPGVMELFKELQGKNIIISLATNSSLKTTTKFINKFELQNFFSFVTTADEVTRRKPDPEIYLIAKAKIKIDDEEILAIEDSGVGTRSAKSAGLKVVAIPNDYTKKQDFSSADYVCNSLQEVVNLFE